MSEETVTSRKLPVDLSTMEVRERSLELSSKIAEARALEARRKAAASEFKASDQEIRARIDELAESVKSGRESRQVECRWSRNESLGRMELARMDTGEVIESRALTPEERQIKMFPRAVDAPTGTDGEIPRKSGKGN